MIPGWVIPQPQPSTPPEPEKDGVWCAKCREDRNGRPWGVGAKGTKYENKIVCGLCAWQIEADKRNAAGFEDKLPKPKRRHYG